MSYSVCPGTSPTPGKLLKKKISSLVYFEPNFSTINMNTEELDLAIISMKNRNPQTLKSTNLSTIFTSHRLTNTHINTHTHLL